MSEHDLPPLDEEIRALVDAERARAGMPDAVRARLRERLQLPPGPGGSGGTPAGSGSTPARSPGGPAAGLAQAGSSAAPGRVLPWTLRVGATAFVVGIAVGVLLDRSLRTAPPIVAATARSAPSELPMAAPASASPTVTAAPPALAAAAPAAAAPPSSPPGSERGAHHHASRGAAHAAIPDGVDEHDTDLAAERALVEMARTALRRGDRDAALLTLETHLARFPRGRLAEERDSLWVQGLVTAGRFAEARRRGERFRSDHPESLLLPAVDATLRSIPAAAP